jgi:hypothetical protein
MGAAARTERRTTMTDDDVFTAEDFEKAKRERIEKGIRPLFELGRIVATPGALATIDPDDMMRAIGRHVRGDWGDVDRHDWQTNEAGLEDGTRLVSVYRSQTGDKFWIITEGDRSVTTLLLPNEY